MKRARPGGFTLIELMVTIAIAAILMAVASPYFGEATLGSKLSASANRLSASVMLARTEAIKRNAAITMCASANGSSCAGSGGWEQGWIVKTATTVLQAEEAASTGMKIYDSTANAMSLTFPSSGVGATAAELVVCRATPTVGAQERQVSISATGRAYVKKTTNSACTG